MDNSDLKTHSKLLEYYKTAWVTKQGTVKQEKELTNQSQIEII